MYDVWDSDLKVIIHFLLIASIGYLYLEYITSMSGGHLSRPDRPCGLQHKYMSETAWNLEILAPPILYLVQSSHCLMETSRETQILNHPEGLLLNSELLDAALDDTCLLSPI